ncbi:MAG: DsbC family protein [Gammaproteobacteria bacterium]|nr:DsbC family protein [Gammaproteobacteria bacterium]
MSFIPALPAAAEPEAEKRIIESLRTVLPDAETARITMSQIPGLYEVIVGSEVFYATADGRYVIHGDMLDMNERRNLSEDQRTATRFGLLSKVPAREMIEFAPANPKYSVYVFTDISCGYCRRLHQNVPEFNRLGIAVRYLAYPRSGPTGDVYRNMVSVWCAADPRQALTEAKLGKPVAETRCVNPVEKQFQLGQVIGVHGTPAIYLENGKALGGYLSPSELLEAVTEE